MNPPTKEEIAIEFCRKYKAAELGMMLKADLESVTTAFLKERLGESFSQGKLRTFLAAVKAYHNSPERC